MTVASWSHTALNCVDQARTERFYVRWLGFSRARVVAVPDAEVVFLRNGPALLELFAVGDTPGLTAGDGPRAAGTVRHIAFQTDDVDAFLSAMGKAADVSFGPVSFDDVIPGWRTVWLRDPDGVVVEVTQGYRDEDTTDDDRRGTFGPRTDIKEST